MNQKLLNDIRDRMLDAKAECSRHGHPFDVGDAMQAVQEALKTIKTMLLQIELTEEQLDLVREAHEDAPLTQELVIRWIEGLIHEELEFLEEERKQYGRGH